MADEIQVSLSLRAVKDPFDYEFAANFSRNLAGVGGGNPGRVRVTSTGNVTVSFGNTTGNGYSALVNLSTGATVNYGPATTGGTLVEFGQLQPKDAAVYRHRATASLVLATTSAVANVRVNRLDE